MADEEIRKAAQLPLGLTRLTAEKLLKADDLHPPLTDEERERLERVAISPVEEDRTWIHVFRVERERFKNELQSSISDLLHDDVPHNIALAALADAVGFYCQYLAEFDDKGSEHLDTLLTYVAERAWGIANGAYYRTDHKDKE